MESFSNWMGKKSNQKILMKLIKDIKKALEPELNYLKKAIKTYGNGVDHSRREGNNGLANYYLVERTQTENRQQILTACKFSIKRLISQSKNYSTFPSKKLGRILSILYQLLERRRLNDKLWKPVQNLRMVLKQFRFGQELEKPFQIRYYEGSFLEDDSLVDGKIVLNILKKMMYADPDIRGVLLFDEKGKILAYRTKFPIERGALGNVGKYTNKMFKGFLKLGTTFNLGKYHWMRSEFTKEGILESKNGIITVFPVGTHIICIIGGYCPNIGMIRMIMMSARSELLEILEKP